MSPLTAYIVESIVTLVGIVVLAVAVLYGARRLGVGRTEGPLRLLGRLPLDGRRAVYLVKVGSLVYVVGASEGGLVRLGEMKEGDVEDLVHAAPVNGAFARALARVTGTGPGRAPKAASLPPNESAASERGERESAAEHG
jgi:flagellar biogenesis protein FliO